jgi:hypothetical protein
VAEQASASEPPVGPRIQPRDRPLDTLTTSPWRAGHAHSQAGRPPPPRCSRRIPVWTPSPPISLCGHPAAAGPGDGHGGPLDRPVGRTSPVRGDRPATGSGPGPDSGGQAADTSSAQRPTMPLPAGHGQPRGLHVLALTGQDGSAHARLRPTSAAPSIGTARRDHLRPCSMPQRPQAWSPSDVCAVVSGVHDGRHDRTAFRTPHVRSIRPDTVQSTRHAVANRKRRGQGTDERYGRRSDSLDRHGHKAAHRHTPSPLPWGRRLQLGNQGWPGDGKIANATVTTAATRQLLGFAPPSKLRLGALLSSEDFGSSVERAARLHPLWRVHGEWTGAVEQEGGSLHGPVGVVGGGGVHPWMTWGVTSGCTGGCRLWVDVAVARWR